MKSPRGPLVVCALLMACTGISRADLLSYSFVGQTTPMGGDPVPIHGSFSYDTHAGLVSATSGAQPSQVFTSAGNMTIQWGNFTFSTDPSTPLQLTLTPASLDLHWEPGSPVVGLPAGPRPAGLLDMDIQVLNRSSVPWTDLSSLPPPLGSSAPVGSFAFDVQLGDPDFRVQGVLTELAGAGIASVPEPAALSLAAVGLCGLLLSVWRHTGSR